jgi:hypothetical protein
MLLFLVNHYSAEEAKKMKKRRTPEGSEIAGVSEKSVSPPKKKKNSGVYRVLADSYTNVCNDFQN